MAWPPQRLFKPRWFSLFLPRWGLARSGCFFERYSMKSDRSTASKSEWIVAAAGALILISCAIILLAGSKGGESAPVIVARIEKVTKTEAGFLVEAKVFNR